MRSFIICSPLKVLNDQTKGEMGQACCTHKTGEKYVNFCTRTCRKEAIWNIWTQTWKSEAVDWIIQVGTRCSFIWTRYWTFVFKKMLWIYLLAEQLLPSQEGLSCVELVNHSIINSSLWPSPWDVCVWMLSAIPRARYTHWIHSLF
jgi:hypothetical protein